MNVADKELCQELYELSGWDDTYDWWYDRDGDIGIATVGTYDWSEYPEYEQYKTVPAYDLGYLLRKLPAMIEDNNDEFYLELSKNDDDDYMIAYTDRKTILFGSPHGSTPENAACKLAIELIKQKVITI